MASTPLATHRRSRHSLRALLVLVLLSSVGIAWLAIKVQQARRQRQAADALQSLGGFVLYDYEPDGAAQVVEPPGPAWLRELLGQYFFTRVARVNLELADVGDAQLEYLRPFA